MIYAQQRSSRPLPNQFQHGFLGQFRNYLIVHCPIANVFASDAVTPEVAERKRIGVSSEKRISVRSYGPHQSRTSPPGSPPALRAPWPLE